jgi:hypothetical protein
VVDVEGSADQQRTTQHRLAVRAGLDLALRHAFDEAGLSWLDCRHEGTGDGAFLLAPAQMSKVPFVEVLPSALAAALRRHNDAHSTEAWIRLRVALHAGEVTYDECGVTAPSINRAFRLLEAPVLKAALAKSSDVLALIASEWFFDEVVRNSAVLAAAAFRRVKISVKETVAVGRISLPDHPYSPDAAQLRCADAPGEPRNQPRPLCSSSADRPGRGEPASAPIAGIDPCAAAPRVTVSLTAYVRGA